MTALAWRGPMAGNALNQLIDAEWGETELLLIDLPPGTGDVQERQHRADLDDQRAARILSEGVDKFVENWYQM